MTDSSVFDMTLLSLLVHSICGYKKPPTGWDNDPDVDDESVIADSVRFRLSRNYVKHFPLSISRKKYKDQYNYLEKALLRRGCTRVDLKRIKPFFRYEVPLENLNFVGRVDELNRIHHAFNYDENKPTVVIKGMPGIGKSELASRYCQVYRDEYDCILWVNANNETTIETAFTSIAKTLQLSDTSSIIVITHLLEEYWKNEKVLIIFDNCDDVNSLHHVVLPGCKHIITTQLENWHHSYEAVFLDIWTEATALEYLVRAMCTTTPWTLHEEQEFKDLVSLLGMHPLGIQHAAAFMKQTKTNVNMFMKFLAIQPDVMAKVKVLDTGVKQSVFQSFLMTIDKICRENTDSGKLLFVLGLLDGTCIDERITKRIFDQDYVYAEARSLLLDYSVIKCNQKTMEFIELTEEYITMHSLYQRAVKYILNRDDLTKNTLEFCLILFPFNKDNGIWFNQLNHLWRQSSYKDIIIESPNLKGFVGDLIRFERKSKQSLGEESLDCCLNKNKNRQSCLPYFNWAQYYKDAIKNVSFPETGVAPTIKFTVERIQTYLEFSVRWKKSPNVQYIEAKTLMQNLSMGNFNDILETVQDIKAKICFIIKGLCLKGTGQYKQALVCFSKFPTYCSPTTISAIQIGCCFILQGDIKRGLDTVEKYEDSKTHVGSMVDIGRALFQVGELEKSKQYFQRFIDLVWKEKTGTYNAYGHVILDGLCKIFLMMTMNDEKKKINHLLSGIDSSLQPRVVAMLFQNRLLQDIGSIYHLSTCNTKRKGLGK